MTFILFVSICAVCIISIMEDNWSQPKDDTEILAEVVYWDAYYKHGLKMDLILMDE